LPTSESKTPLGIHLGNDTDQPRAERWQDESRESISQSWQVVACNRCMAAITGTVY
jgi:post-segregation antitoxin (ccd killing protein)